MLGNGDLILRYLEHLGVEYVFGVPGAVSNPFMTLWPGVSAVGESGP